MTQIKVVSVPPSDSISAHPGHSGLSTPGKFYWLTRYHCSHPLPRYQCSHPPSRNQYITTHTAAHCLLPLPQVPAVLPTLQETVLTYPRYHCSHLPQVPLFSPALGTSVHNLQVPVSSPPPDNSGPQILQIIDVSVFPSNSRLSSCRRPGSWLLQATVVLSTPAKFFQLSQSTVVTAHQMAGVLASSCDNGSH